MKFSVDVDCTPEEARGFLGLPDLTPVHDAYLDKMKAMVTEGVTPDAIEQMMKNWGPMSEAGMAMWRQFFDRMGTMGGGALPKS